jgi:hypothetical protein
MTKYKIKKDDIKKTCCDILEAIRVKNLKKLVPLYIQCTNDMVMG